MSMGIISETLCRNTKKDLIHIIRKSDAPIKYKLKASTCFFLKIINIKK